MHVHMFMYCIAREQTNCVTFTVSLSSFPSLSDSDTYTHFLGWKYHLKSEEVKHSQWKIKILIRTVFTYLPACLLLFFTILLWSYMLYKQGVGGER